MVLIFPFYRNMLSIPLSGIAWLLVNFFHFKLLVPNQFQLITEAVPIHVTESNVRQEVIKQEEKKNRVCKLELEIFTTFS